MLTFVFIAGTLFSQSGESNFKSMNLSKDPKKTRGSADPLAGLNVALEEQEMIIGEYYALIIGIDKYSGAWQPLNNAVRDARTIKETLESTYKIDHFRTLYDDEASRENIIKAFEWLMKAAKDNDNVLIYYSGHGEYVRNLDKGFWVPADASTSSVSNYISNTDIQTYLGGINSKHTLLISDACFSGDIFRGKTVSIPFEDSDRYYNTVHNRMSRSALTSGGVEPVMDGGREGHSVFAYYVLKALQTNDRRFYDASQLYGAIKIPVINNSEQSPKFEPIKNTGDEGGQFIFIRKDEID